MPAWGWLAVAGLLAALVWFGALNGIAWLVWLASALLLVVAAACGWAIWVGLQSARPGDRA